MTKRKAGTGTVVRATSGRWVAKAPGGKKHLGTYDTKREATEVLDAFVNQGDEPTELSAYGLTRGIGRYLDALANGHRATGTVFLGALPGFPQNTDDPEVVERAIATIRKSPPAQGSIATLKRQQRIITLQAAADALRTNDAADNPETFFIEHAKEWATENRIGYSAFRAMGVPARVLSEAGITRTDEP